MSTEIERLWENNELVGRKVRLKQPEKRVRYATVETLYDDIPGGVIVSPLLDGFRSWNIDELQLKEKGGRSAE